MRRNRDNTISLAESFEGARSDYNAVKSSRYRRRRTGVSASGSGADWHYRSEADYLRMMEQARDMDRNDTVVGQTVTRAVDNTIQDGIGLDPETGDSGIDKELSARWKAWGTDPEMCDSQGEFTFRDMEHFALRQTFVDGDIVGLGMQDGSLRLVEAHRIRTPRSTSRNVVHGILLDEKRRRLQYWITRDDIDPTRAVSKVSDIVPVSVRDADGNRQVFHVYNPKRSTQTRGVTAFAPIFDSLGMFEDINFAKLIQQQVVSCFGVIRERGPSWEGGNGTPFGEQTTTTSPTGTATVAEQIRPGMFYDGAMGEKLTGFSPAVPNPGYFEHVRLILTLVGVNLGMPLVMVLMDSSETNFSGWRGAWDQAKIGFRRNQRWLTERFHRPVYLWKVRQWIAEDSAFAGRAAALGEAIFAHRWNPPTWSYIDPYKDASADLLRDRGGLISKRRLHRENNVEWNELSTEIVDDNAMGIIKAKKKAAEINKEFPDDEPITWREILSMPTPEGTQVALAPQAEKTDDTAPPKNGKPANRFATNGHN